MTDKKVTSEAAKKATQSYRERNREKTRHQSYKSSAKTFIRKYATLEELEELKQMISEREKEYKK